MTVVVVVIVVVVVVVVTPQLAHLCPVAGSAGQAAGGVVRAVSPLWLFPGSEERKIIDKFLDRTERVT